MFAIKTAARINRDADGRFCSFTPLSIRNEELDTPMASVTRDDRYANAGYTHRLISVNGIHYAATIWEPSQVLDEFMSNYSEEDEVRERDLTRGPVSKLALHRADTELNKARAEQARNLVDEYSEDRRNLRIALRIEADRLRKIQDDLMYWRDLESDAIHDGHPAMFHVVVAPAYWVRGSSTKELYSPHSTQQEAQERADLMGDQGFTDVFDTGTITVSGFIPYKGGTR